MAAESGPAEDRVPLAGFEDPRRHWTRAQRVALARQLRSGMTTSEVARRLGVTASTVRDYLSDPDGIKSQGRRRRTGRCASCGAQTGRPRGERVFSLCARCAPRRRTRWTRDSVISAYITWHNRFGTDPVSTDWNRTHATRRGGLALERYRSGRWPTSTVIVRLFRDWAGLQHASRAQGAKTPHRSR
jgi:AcrR family transcriptional regulator